MKKIKKILLFVLILMGSNIIDAYSSIIITLKIARKRDCKGFGWCKGTVLFEDDGAAKPIGNTVNALADFMKDGRLIITLNKKTDMTPEAFTTYFSKGTFLCEDDFQLPDDMLKALNHVGNYIIEPGEYPVKIDGDLVSVIF